jgi:uncharacterized protein (TIGR02588 family)
MAQSSARKDSTRKTAASKAPARSAGKAGAPGETPLLEWIAAAVGLVVLVGVLGFVGAEAFRPDTSPPQVVVEKLGVERTDAGYLVRVRAINRGGSAAAQVVVEGELEAGAGQPETAEATFDFIADHSSREGGLFFESDPGQGRLTLRAKGYAAP